MASTSLTRRRCRIPDAEFGHSHDLGGGGVVDLAVEIYGFMHPGDDGFSNLPTRNCAVADLAPPCGRHRPKSKRRWATLPRSCHAYRQRVEQNDRRRFRRRSNREPQLTQRFTSRSGAGKLAGSAQSRRANVVTSISPPPRIRRTHGSLSIVIRV